MPAEIGPLPRRYRPSRIGPRAPPTGLCPGRIASRTSPGCRALRPRKESLCPTEPTPPAPRRGTVMRRSCGRPVHCPVAAARPRDFAPVEPVLGPVAMARWIRSVMPRGPSLRLICEPVLSVMQSASARDCRSSLRLGCCAGPRLPQGRPRPRACMTGDIVPFQNPNRSAHLFYVQSSGREAAWPHLQRLDREDILFVHGEDLGPSLRRAGQLRRDHGKPARRGAGRGRTGSARGMAGFGQPAGSAVGARHVDMSWPSLRGSRSRPIGNRYEARDGRR